MDLVLGVLKAKNLPIKPEYFAKAHVTSETLNELEGMIELAKNYEKKGTSFAKVVQDPDVWKSYGEAFGPGTAWLVPAIGDRGTIDTPGATFLLAYRGEAPSPVIA